MKIIKSIKNPFKSNWNTIIKIREALISNHNLLKIHWVQSHTCIIGNEKAKFASHAPFITNNTLEKIIFDSISAIMSKINLNRNSWLIITTQLQTPKTVIRSTPQTLGKKKWKYFPFPFFSCMPPKKPTQAPICTRCNSSLTIGHILTECPLLSDTRLKLFGNIYALDLLKNPSVENIDNIYNFIKLTKLRV